MHIWTDGSWEQGVAGLGAVVFDCESGQGAVFHGGPLEGWSWIATDLRDRTFCNRCNPKLLDEQIGGSQVHFWTDNDSARAAMIKGYSSSLAMHVLVRRLASVEAGGSCIRWVDRKSSIFLQHF